MSATRLEVNILDAGKVCRIEGCQDDKILRRLMVRAVGPLPSKKKLLMVVVHAIHLYGCEIWADTLKKENILKSWFNAAKRRSPYMNIPMTPCKASCILPSIFYKPPMLSFGDNYQLT